MYNFFVESDKINGDIITIDGANYNHLKNVLRMGIGDTFLVSCDGKSNLCELHSIDGGLALAKITERDYQNTELPIKIYLHKIDFLYFT